LARAASSVRRPTRDIDIAAQYLPGTVDEVLRLVRDIAATRRQQLDDRLPVAFANVLEKVERFADPTLTGLVGHDEWDPERGAWQAAAAVFDSRTKIKRA